MAPLSWCWRAISRWLEADGQTIFAVRNPSGVYRGNLGGSRQLHQISFLSQVSAPSGPKVHASCQPFVRPVELEL